MLHCGHQWYLSRGLHLPEAPAWALVGGSAVHKATEWYDQPETYGAQARVPTDEDDPRVLFGTAFDEAMAEQIKRAPEEYFDPSTWKASGRASKQYPDKENEKWWRANGPTFVGNWINWRQNSNLDFWRNDKGEAAIELEAEVEIAGLPVKLFIDRVMTGPFGPIIIDLKSGSNIPKDGLQLGIYALAMKVALGIEVKYGQYWDARHGMATPAFDLTLYPQERLDYVFGGVRRMQEQGIFIPHVTAMCSACGVRRFCKAYGGERAGEVEQPW